jgi:hypothetical protein
VKELKAAVERFAATGPVMGPEQKIDIDRFREDLLAISNRNAKFFWVPFITLTILLALGVASFVIWRAVPLKASGLLAAAGLPIPWLVREMKDFWNTKVQSDTLLVLASSLDPAIMTSIAKAILKNMVQKAN